MEGQKVRPSLPGINFQIRHNTVNFRKLAYLALLYLLLSSSPSCGQSTAPEIFKQHVQDIKEIIINPGVNDVHFDAIGDNVKVISTFFENQDAHSHDTFMVVVLDKTFDVGLWLIVPILDRSGSQYNETIQDNLLSGEDLGASVRFFNAKIDGKKGTLLIVSSRDLNQSGTFYGPSRDHILIYQFHASTLGLGSPYVFSPYLDFWTEREYCNADAALQSELSIPWINYEKGLDKLTGCL